MTELPPTEEPIRVAVVDDQALIRAGLKLVLDAEPDMRLVGEAADGRAGIELALRGDVDVVLMDIRMPVLDGVAATREIVAAAPERPRVIVLTTFDLDEYAYAALAAGASGFLLKDAGPPELLSGIRAVHHGDAVVAPSTTRRLLERLTPALEAGPGAADPERLAVLTEREREVMSAVARGLSNTEIAATLYLAEATVKTHVGRILAKLDLRDRVQIVVLAYETGLVRVGDVG